MSAMTSFAVASTSSRCLTVRCTTSEPSAPHGPSHVSLPVVSLPAAPVSTSAHAPFAARLAIDPSAAYANLTWFRGTFNTQVVVSENEAAESVVRRFRKAVLDANVINECRRRKRHETPQDTIKRKQKEAVRARRRGQFGGRGGGRGGGGGGSFRNREDNAETKAKQDDDDDFWGADADL